MLLMLQKGAYHAVLSWEISKPSLDRRRSKPQLHKRNLKKNGKKPFKLKAKVQPNLGYFLAKG